MVQITGPQRSNTAESLSDPFIRKLKIGRRDGEWFPRLRVQKHQIPRYLCNLIHDLPRSNHKYNLQRFLENLGSHRDKTKLLEKCIWASTIDGYPCESSHTQSIAHNLNIVQQELLEAKYRDLAFCAISVAAVVQFEAYAPWDITSKEARLLYYRLLLAMVLEDRWPGSAKQIGQCMVEMEQRPPPQLAWRPELPSSDVFETEMIWNEPTLQGLDLALEWPYEVPIIQLFLGSLDWGIYVAQPYTERPRLNALRIVDVTAEGSPHCRVALITNSHCVLGHLKHSFDEARAAGIIGTTNDVEYRLFDVLLACLHTVVWGTTEYLAASVKLIQDINDATAGPEVSNWAAQACRTNAREVSAICRSPIPVTRQVHRAQRRADDFDYLADELEKHMRQIEALKDTIISQVELFDKRRNKIIQMFVAVYVPLAFATSFFGMNISDNSISTIWTNTTSSSYNATADSTGTNTTDLQYWHLQGLELKSSSPVIQTTTLVTENQPGNLTWPLWVFFTVAGALTLGSIIIPLTAGHIYRWIVRFSRRRRTTFRVFVSTMYALLYFFTAIIRYHQGRSIAIAGLTGIGLGFAILPGRKRAHRRVRRKAAWCTWMFLNAASVFVSTGLGLPWDMSLELYRWVVNIVWTVEGFILLLWSVLN